MNNMKEKRLAFKGLFAAGKSDRRNFHDRQDLGRRLCTLNVE